MRVPFVNYKQSYRILRYEIDKAIKNCLKGGDLILRKDVEEFEQRVARMVKMRYAVGLNSGTDALFLALKALNIGTGDEVITTSYTFIATIAAIVNVGAMPVLVDVDERGLMDLEWVKKNLTSRTKAIIPVHMNGEVVDIKKLKEIAKVKVRKYKVKGLSEELTAVVPVDYIREIPIIEDSAQAFGVKTTADGIIKCFSHYPAKMLGCYGDGGSLATSDKNIAERIKVLRDNAQKRLKGGQKIEEALMVEFGYNSRLDNIQAAILNVKIKHFKQHLKRRYEIVRMYNRGLKLKRSSPQNYIYMTPQRDDLKRYLATKGIETLVRDQIPNHKHPGLGFEPINLPMTDRFAMEAIALPLYPELTNNQVKYVINKVKKWEKYVRTKILSR